MFTKKCHVGEIWNCIDGQFEIIEDNGIFDKNNQRLVKVKFLTTGDIQNAIYKNAIHGKIHDKQKFFYDNKDKIFHSNSYGDYKIIKYNGCAKGNEDQVLIHFIDTGNEYYTRKTSALAGKVKDTTRFMYENGNKIFHSNNSGDFVIIDEAGYPEDDLEHRHKLVKIKFLDTGSETIARYEECIKGFVLDPLYNTPNQARIINGQSQMVNIDSYLYQTWKGIMARCYNKNNPSYKRYGAAGVTVSEPWKNFEIFKYDATHIPGWFYKYNNPMDFQIDKDLLQINTDKSNKIYSRNTCIWLDKERNIKLAFLTANINVYDDTIFDIDGIYFVKSHNPNYFSYGPFFSFYEANNCPRY